MSYIRFVTPRIGRSSGFEEGLFHLVRDLLEQEDLSPDDRVTLEAVRKWFNEELEKPSRFSRSSSKGHWRRNARGIAWFKDTAEDHLFFMRVMKRVAEEYGYIVHEIVESRIGYVVYEDEHQVVAEPFADTRTGS